jgi:hypothetical protein
VIFHMNYLPTLGSVTDQLSAPSGLLPLLTNSLTYRGTSLIRKRTPLGTYSRAMPRALWWFLMSEVPL